MGRPVIRKLCACGCGQKFESRWRKDKKRYTEFIIYHGVRGKPLSDDVLDLKNPLYAYMYGLLQADGHLRQGTRNRGNVSLELAYVDRPILEEFHKVVPRSKLSDRTRDTNFKKSYKAAVWRVSFYRFRERLQSYGFPAGKKSKRVKLPSVKFSKPDYFRGLIDGDGSVGVTAKGIPFVSLTTSSDDIYHAYSEFHAEITGKTKNNKRNKRDKVYNIVSFAEDAQKLISVLYYDKCLALHRKMSGARKALAWERPEGMIRIPDKKFWDARQDTFILTHSIKESMRVLKRSESSIKTRLWRLSLNANNLP